MVTNSKYAEIRGSTTGCRELLYAGCLAGEFDKTALTGQKLAALSFYGESIVGKRSVATLTVDKRFSEPTGAIIGLKKNRRKSGFRINPGERLRVKWPMDRERTGTNTILPIFKELTNPRL